MKVKEKYKGWETKPLFKQGNFKSEWCGSYDEIRITGTGGGVGTRGSIVLTIPSHGKWLQLGSTIKKVGDIKTIYELAKKSITEVYTR